VRPRGDEAQLSVQSTTVLQPECEDRCVQEGTRPTARRSSGYAGDSIQEMNLPGPAGLDNSVLASRSVLLCKEVRSEANRRMRRLQAFSQQV
jgi:hypothetical protein